MSFQERNKKIFNPRTPCYVCKLFFVVPVIDKRMNAGAEWKPAEAKKEQPKESKGKENKQPEKPAEAGEKSGTKEIEESNRTMK